MGRYIYHSWRNAWKPRSYRHKLGSRQPKARWAADRRAEVCVSSGGLTPTQGGPAPASHPGKNDCLSGYWKHPGQWVRSSGFWCHCGHRRVEQIFKSSWLNLLALEIRQIWTWDSAFTISYLEKAEYLTSLSGFMNCQQLLERAFKNFK